MSNHQKRLSVPKSWPVERKTDVFTVKARAGPHGEAGVPLVIILRDVLGYVDSKKEARYALSQDAILVNGEPINDEKRPIGMFDIVGFPGREEYYRVFPDEGGRLSLTEIDADAADSRLGKVVGKQQVKGGETCSRSTTARTSSSRTSTARTTRSSSTTRTSQSSRTSPTRRVRWSPPSAATTAGRSANSSTST
ncbi:S4 domain-containing protein [Saliphagus sp. GCM10025308]